MHPASPLLGAACLILSVGSAGIAAGAETDQLALAMPQSQVDVVGPPPAGLLPAALIDGETGPPAPELLAFATPGDAVPALHFPTPEEQAETFAPYADLEIEGLPVIRFLVRHQVLLLTDVRHVTALPGGGFSVASDAIACAAPISGDGYLLTAAHAVHGPVYAVIDVDGRPTPAPVRVVWRGDQAAGCDLALIKVAWRPPAPCAWSTLAELDAGTAVLSAGAYLVDDEGSGQWFRHDQGAGDMLRSPTHIDGQAEAVNGSPAQPPYETIVARLLAHPGDSGGPVMTTHGRLIGVTIGHLLDSAGVSTGLSVIARPDVPAIEAMMAKDRAGHGAEE